MESLIVSLLVLAIVLAALYYIASLLPEPASKIARVIIIVGALLWLLLHVRQIVAVIAGS